MKRRNKMAALILTVILLATLSLSYDYFLGLVRHKCTGAGCPVCIQLEGVAQTILNLKFVPVILFVIAAHGILIKSQIMADKSVCVKRTLIVLKVRLQN